MINNSKNQSATYSQTEVYAMLKRQALLKSFHMKPRSEAMLNVLEKGFSTEKTPEISSISRKIIRGKTEFSDELHIHFIDGDYIIIPSNRNTHF